MPWLCDISIRFLCASQLWLLLHSNFLTRFLLSLFYTLDLALFKIQGVERFMSMRSQLLGSNFASFGKLLIGDYEQASEIIHEVQKRGNFLGRTRLVRKRIPKGFLLFLSDEEAGGTELHRTLHQHVWEFIILPAQERQKQAVFSTYITELVEATVPTGDALKKKDRSHRVQDMVIRYLFHLLFGVHLTDPQLETIRKLFVTGGLTENYIASAVIPFAPAKCFLGKVKRGMTEIQQIIVNSPVLREYVPSPANANLTKEEYSFLLLSMVGIAGILGTTDLAASVLTDLPDDYPIDIGDDRAVVRAVLEIARRRAPVFMISIITNEPRKFIVGGLQHEFPAGTTVASNIWLANLDASRFVDPDAFKPDRYNLLSSPLTFNAIGYEPIGLGRRTCPGRNVALKICSDLLIAVRKEKISGMDKLYPRDYLQSKSVSVDELLVDGKFRADKGPRVARKGSLPTSMQGIFWLFNQDGNASLLSFARSNDGGGTGEGELKIGKNAISIRVAGDRTFAFSDKGTAYKHVEDIDLVYHFRPNYLSEPTEFSIVPEFVKESISVDGDFLQWVLNFSMFLMTPEQAAQEGYQGSIVWKGKSTLPGRPAAKHSLVQIVDENSRPLYPAYQKWLDYTKSAVSGESPGVIHYWEATGACIVRIMTGSTHDAGSKSQAYIRLHGTKGKSSDYELPESEYRTNSLKRFVVKVPDIGDIIGLSLWRDAKLTDFSPNWFVNWVTVEVVGSPKDCDIEAKALQGAKNMFPIYSWILYEPTIFLEGRARLASNVNESNYAQEEIRCRYIAEKCKEYQYTSFHVSLGDWGNTLPRKVMLRNGRVPINETRMIEEVLDFRGSSTIALSKGLFATLKSSFCRKPRTLDNYVEQQQVVNMKVHQNAEQPDYSRNWRDDATFARLATSGISPVDLKVIDKIPKAFSVTDDMMPGKHRSVKGELRAKHLFMLDFDAVKKMAGAHDVSGETRYLAAPYVLLHCESGGVLMPLAIQIDRTKGSPVFTPNDDVNDWLAAKIYASNCMFHVHQFRTHALWCHLSQEPIAVATVRRLPSSHPIYKLLRPHFEGLMEINNSARGTLVSAKDRRSLASALGDILSVGAHGNARLAQIFYKDFSLERVFFEERLAMNGVLKKSIIEDYPYRDDGYVVLNATKKYVEKIVEIFYTSDNDVSDDHELQAWALDMVEEGKVRGLPGGGEIKTRAMLCHICANVIFIASAFHAAVNFNQVTLSGVVASLPGAVYRAPPAKKGALKEEDLIDILPPFGRAMLQIGVAGVLSRRSGDRLGNFSEVLFVESSALAVQEEFRQDLKQAESVIKKRNLLRPEPYWGMLPSLIPNSTAI